jgi:hypothetical protein
MFSAAAAAVGDVAAGSLRRAQNADHLAALHAQAGRKFYGVKRIIKIFKKF